MIQYLKEHRDLSLVYRKDSKAVSHIGSLGAAFPELIDVPSIYLGKRSKSTRQKGKKG